MGFWLGFIIGLLIGLLPMIWGLYRAIKMMGGIDGFTKFKFNKSDEVDLKADFVKEEDKTDVISENKEQIYFL